MSEVRVGDQLIRFDRQATVAAYSQIAQGFAAICPCSGCRNFALLRNQAYPEVFRSFLDTLGIDPTKEGEAIHHGPQGNRHFYGGWFCFVGELIEVGERLVGLDQEFTYFVRTSLTRPLEVFGSTVAAVEFTALLPWVLEQPWDPALDAQLAKAGDIMVRYEGALHKLANTP